MANNQHRVGDDPLARAVASVVEVQHDPLEATRRVKEMERATQASYTLIFNLVKRLGGGPLTIPRGDMLIPADEHLLLNQDAQGNVHVAIERKPG